MIICYAKFETKKNSLSKLSILLFNLLYLVKNINCIDNGNPMPMLLLITYSGLKPDLINKYSDITVNLNHLKLISSYGNIKSSSTSSKSYSYDWSMVTGKYEESYDIAELDKSINAKLIEWFIGKNKLIEPIWILNEKKINRKGATTNWTGSNIIFNNTKILNILQKNSSSYDLIDQYLKLFKDKSNPINFGAINFSKTENNDSDKEIVKKFDDTIGYLLTQLKKLKLFDRINLIITTDLSHVHRLERNKIIYLDKFIDINQIDSKHGSLVLVNLFFKKEVDLDAIYNNLTKIEKIDIIKKDRLAIDENYLLKTSSDLLGQILIRSKPGNIIQMSQYETESDHNEEVLFLGQGPAFKKNFYEKEIYFSIVDLYFLMCSILDLAPDSFRDAKSDQIENMLVISNKRYIPIYIILSLIPVIMASIVAISLCIIGKKLNLPGQSSFTNGYIQVSTSENNLVENEQHDNMINNEEL